MSSSERPVVADSNLLKICLAVKIDGEVVPGKTSFWVEESGLTINLKNRQVYNYFVQSNQRFRVRSLHNGYVLEEMNGEQATAISTASDAEGSAGLIASAYRRILHGVAKLLVKDRYHVPKLEEPLMGRNFPWEKEI